MSDENSCTLFPDGTWRRACGQHDHAYRGGGTVRWLADVRLLQDVAATGHPWVALAMFVGVRLGGAPFWWWHRR